MHLVNYLIESSWVDLNLEMGILLLLLPLTSKANMNSFLLKTSSKLGNTEFKKSSLYYVLANV